jgi:YbbR domain-containing protein
MKEKLTRNIGVKILSIILATLLWLVITNINDPVRYKTFEIPVKILNEDLINTLNQSYDIIEGDVAKFKVAARRTIIEDLSEKDFDVTANFANLSNVNAVDIMISPNRYKDDIEIVDRGDIRTVKISIEELSKKDIKVTVVDKGKVGEGYYLGPRSANPNIVRVNGPKSIIDKVKQLVVEANVEGATTDIYRILEPIALDEEGNVMDASRFTISNTNIIVGIEMYEIKEIPLKITTTGKPADGYKMTDIDYQPQTIEVAAEKSQLSNIKRLEVYYDITGAAGNIEEFIELQGRLESGVQLVGSDTTASVKITIEKLETKQISIWPNDIDIKNVPSGLQVTLLTKGPIDVTVNGTPSELADVNRNTLKPYINMQGYSSGTYYVDLESEISDTISYNGKPKIFLVVMPVG